MPFYGRTYEIQMIRNVTVQETVTWAVAAADHAMAEAFALDCQDQLNWEVEKSIPGPADIVVVERID